MGKAVRLDKFLADSRRRHENRCEEADPEGNGSGKW